MYVYICVHAYLKKEWCSTQHFHKCLHAALLTNSNAYVCSSFCKHINIHVDSPFKIVKFSNFKARAFENLTIKGECVSYDQKVKNVFKLLISDITDCQKKLAKFC